MIIIIVVIVTTLAQVSWVGSIDNPNWSASEELFNSCQRWWLVVGHGGGGRNSLFGFTGLEWIARGAHDASTEIGAISLKEWVVKAVRSRS